VLTPTVNVCEDTPESSSFTASFMDGDRSFVFTSTSITTVECQLIGGECNITINGMGLVTGEITPRNFIVRFIDRSTPLSDQLNLFVIVGFTNLTSVCHHTFFLDPYVISWGVNSPFRVGCHSLAIFG
jgi:hypothetical protein